MTGDRELSAPQRLLRPGSRHDIARFVVTGEQKRVILRYGCRPALLSSSPQDAEPYRRKMNAKRSRPALEKNRLI
jgi:hypothetical protein